ncbi:MAG: DUF5060 domain-containing protein, partial [Planctomycetes bacterium]|nr:DUF5060 domain-containing protein [Planctomycetota bacterium]
MNMITEYTKDNARPHDASLPCHGLKSLGLILILSMSLSATEASANDVHGTLMQWHKTVISFKGPDGSESASPNPFSDYRLDVTFTDPAGQTRRVPGYYAADGRAAHTSADSGSVWQVRFVPDEPGIWGYRASFVTGKDVATQLTGGKSAGYCDGDTGSFHIGPSDKDAPNARARGLLQYTGGHYLQFAGTEEYYLKGGADSPENFLAYGEIDNTYDADAGSGSYSHIGGFLHQYKPHVQDWRPGDPTWKNGKGKGIVGALNYLAGKGMNSVYFLTYNLDGGDGRDTWMWTDVDERRRFDCSKLDQWEIIFDHMDQLGIMLHVVTQETENDQRLGGSAGLNLIRRLYYRELVARFSHHLALIWNLGEENNTPDSDRKEIAAYIHALDPYDHPITVHTHNDQALKFYNGILGDEGFEATSIQGHVDRYNREATVLRQRSAEAGRKWVIFADEQAAASHGVVPDANDPTHDIPRKEGLWGNLMGGGAGVEWYFGHQFPHMDINCEDWRSRDILWNQTRHALMFFQTYLPFWDMTPANRLTSTEDDYCFAKQG